MALPAIMMGVGAGMSALGMLGQARSARRLARDARGFTIDTQEIQQGLGDLNSFNARNAALRDAQAANPALRGAGRNSYGILREVAQDDARRRFGDRFGNALDQRVSQQNSQRTSLLSLLQSSRGQQANIQAQMRMGAANAAQGAFGELGDLGGMFLGQGMGMHNTMQDRDFYKSILENYSSPTRREAI